MREFLQQFTLPRVAANIVISLLVSGLIRLVGIAFGAIVQNGVLYWVATPLLVFLLLAVAFTLSQKGRLPAFRVNLESVGVGPYQGDDGPSAGVLLVASIKNTGFPSVADHFRFTATLPGGKSMEGTLHYIPDGMEVPHLYTGKTETFSSQEALIERAQKGPIASGGLIRGRMWYVFPNILPDTMGAAGTVWELSVSDAWGRWYKGTMLFTAPGPSSPGVFPQLPPT
jgi:hypothetical protein